MKIEIPVVRVRMVVEAEVEIYDPDDLPRVEADLIGDAVAVKSGLYENRTWGQILSVERVGQSTTKMEVDD